MCALGQGHSIRSFQVNSFLPSADVDNMLARDEGCGGGWIRMWKYFPEWDHGYRSVVPSIEANEINRSSRLYTLKGAINDTCHVKPSLGLS